MFRQHAGEDLVAQLEFMAAEGFTALEDNGMRGRPVADQERIGKALARLNMRMGVFVAHTINWNEPTLTTGDPAQSRHVPQGGPRVHRRREARQREVDDRRPRPRRSPAAHRLSRPRNVVETLKRACGDPRAARPRHGARAAQHAAQPSGHVPDARFRRRISSARRSRARRARSSSTSTISRSPKGISSRTSTRAWDEIAYFQAGDNPGRNEPGTGEINYRNVFKHIHGKGFTGVVGMEHGNAVARPRRRARRHRRVHRCRRVVASRRRRQLPGPE